MCSSGKGLNGDPVTREELKKFAFVAPPVLNFISLSELPALLNNSTLAWRSKVVVLSIYVTSPNINIEISVGY